MRHLIVRVLTLCAVLLMPLGMAPALAASHHGMSTSMPMQHCPEQGAKHRSNAAFGECTMACASALPAVDSLQERPIPFPPMFAAPAPVHELHGLHPETETPPPRTA